MSLNDVDAVIERTDPPFNMEYVYATYLLERLVTRCGWELGLEQAEHLLLDPRVGLAGQPHEVEGPWSEATGGGGHGTPRYCQGAPRRTPRILH